MRVRLSVLSAAAVVAVAVAGCGSSGGSAKSASSGKGVGSSCDASLGVEAPITGAVAQLGGEQLAFAELAVENADKKNGTHISIVQGDEQLEPAQATTVTQQFISNGKVVAIDGPASSDSVTAVGPLLERAGLAAISGSATEADLTSGKYPTFFRVVANNNVEGPQDAHYIIENLKPKAIMIVDDQSSYSTSLTSVMIPIFEKAGVKVVHESVSQTETDFSSLVSKITPEMSVVVLPWQIAANAQQFGRDIQEQHIHATIFGTDGTFSPEQFTIAGSYVSSFGPNINSIAADASLAKQAQAKDPGFGTYGPPVYAAAYVEAQAIARVCKAGETPSRSNVLAQIKKTDEPTSILGQPIKFDSKGDLQGDKFFIFKISSAGKYQLITSSSGS